MCVCVVFPGAAEAGSLMPWAAVKLRPPTKGGEGGSDKHGEHTLLPGSLEK